MEAREAEARGVGRYRDRMGLNQLKTDLKHFHGVKSGRYTGWGEATLLSYDHIHNDKLNSGIYSPPFQTPSTPWIPWQKHIFAFLRHWH